MQEYWINEGKLLLPPHWRDTTINVFSVSGPKTQIGANATFLITRDEVTKAVSLNHYADLQLVEAAKKLASYKLIGRNATRINQQAAIEVDFRWRTPERVEVIQKQAYIQHGTGYLIFTLTLKSDKPLDLEENWREVLSSIQLRN